MRALFSSLIAFGITAHLLAGCGDGSSPASTGTSSSGGAGGSPTSSSSSSSSSSGSGVCDPPLAAVTPSGTDDVTYSGQTELSCFGEPCLCAPGAREFVDHVLACDPIAGGFFLQQGSLYVRVVGRESGACVLDVGGELEGGVTYTRCKLPLPVMPWAGIAGSDPAVDPTAFLEGITDRCQEVGKCCIADGCPDPCATDLPAAPLCPIGKPASSCN